MTNRLAIVASLEAARKAQGLTQEALAARAGTSRVTVGRVEAGFDPRLATVYEMARALGLEMMVVPRSLASEVQAFIQSGGRLLGQPSGAGAPDSVVAQALATSKAIHQDSRGIANFQPSPHSARSLAQQVSERVAEVRSSSPNPVWSARSVAQGGVFAPPEVGVVAPRVDVNYPGTASMGLLHGPGVTSPAKEGSKGPAISPAALARLHGVPPTKGGNR